MIALYRGKSRISRGIRWQTRGPYSHAAWLCSDGSVYESWHRGGVVHSESVGSIHTPGTEVDLFAVQVDNAQVERFLESQLGKHYDWRAIMGFVSRCPQLADEQDKWFCSELVFAACAFAGVGLFRLGKPEPVRAWEVSPSKLAWSNELIYQRREITGG